ncbi:MAG: helix-turn-helix transcriptional regulator [Bacilli bacterium]|nr:helix-turn-helix transcriptional regulator [Bacilli bacterium]
MSLGNKIYEHRKKIGMSQEELGFKLNVTRQSVSLWENDQAQPSIDNLKKLAEIFNVSIDELCGSTIISTKENNDDNSEPLVKASVVYTEDLYQKMYRLYYKKRFVVIIIAIIISILFLLDIILSNSNKEFIIIPLLFIIIFVSALLGIHKQIYKQVQSGINLNPNLNVNYLFYSDHFILESTSDNSRATYNKRYDQIKTRFQDENYIYLLFDVFFTIIDKRTCNQKIDLLLQLLYLKKEDNINKKVKKLLMIFFILSIVSIFIALMVVAISISLSPLPEFPLVMVEHMWKFFLVIPLPITSVILGVVYYKKGYKCKKNIIAGVIMTFILCIYGSFSSVFASKISHNPCYIDDISNMINFNIPTDGYVSVYKDYNHTGGILAMVKIEKNGDLFLLAIEKNKNWKEDSSFIPSNTIDLYLFTLTSNYDYFMVYNTRTNDYNLNFDNNIIYFAYDVETNVLLIYSY